MNNEKENTLKTMLESLPDSSELKKMTVKDVLKSRQFRSFISSEINKAVDETRRARLECKYKGLRVARTTIDSLRDKDVLEPGKMTALFAEVIDKVNKTLSSSEREQVRRLGMAAYNRTILEMYENEKKGDNNTGENK